MSKVLLAVLAHPDDESFGMGGTLALYARQGVQAHLICATRGEVGEMDPSFLQDFASAAEVREHELRCAAAELGLTAVHFLDYRDSGMPGSPDNQHPRALTAQPLDEVAAKVAALMRQIRPQVVLTFDPIGGYRHPDHIAIQRATVQAFAQVQAEDGPLGPQKLYFHTINRSFLRGAVKILPFFGKDPRAWGQNGDIDLASLVEVDYPVNISVNYKPVAKQKKAASLCHASQGGAGLAGGITGLVMRVVGDRENFMRAEPPAPPNLREHDLFEGVRLNGAAD
jgi:LmbE family N-acetylglucosaminyl deacetylase